MSWGKVDDSIFEHPKTIVTAKDLRISKVQMVGHLIALWAGARKFAENGDLSRFDDDMIAGLANYEGAAAEFVGILQARGWIDGKLIHDWLDYSGPWLVTKYKTRKRDFLVATWALHGRQYGRDTSGDDDSEGDEPKKAAGSNREQSGNKAGSDREDQDKALDQELDQALSPQAQRKKETKSPNGGLGGETSASADETEPQGSLSFFTSGLRAQGLSPPPKDLPCGGFTVEEVFSAFETLFKFQGLHGPYDLMRRADHCKVDPARWTMLFLDKVDIAYRDNNGVTLVDSEDADPVGMTISGFRPGPGKQEHTPTEAARGFFIEIMQDTALAAAGMTSRYKRVITPSLVTMELSRRKGKRKTA